MQAGLIKELGVYILLCLIWGTTWLGIKASLESLTPFTSAGIRFFLASLIIYLLMKFKGLELQKDKTSVRLYLMMGFFSFVIPFGLVYWAQQYVPSGLAAVLFAVYPFFVVLFSFIRIPGEQIGVLKILGITSGFAGIVVIFSVSFSSDISDFLLGMMAIVLSGIMQANIAVSLKKFGGHLHSLSMNLIPMLIAGFFMILIALAFEDVASNQFDLNAIISVSYLAVFGSVVTFTSFYWLLKRVNIIVLSMIAFITPIVALIAGWIAYNEQLSTRHFIGTLLVLLGLLWANLGAYKHHKSRNKQQK